MINRSWRLAVFCYGSPHRRDTDPSIIHLSKTSKHINRANQIKNTYNIGLDAKVHVGLFNRLHVAHKNNTNVEIIYNQNTKTHTHM